MSSKRTWNSLDRMMTASLDRLGFLCRTRARALLSAALLFSPQIVVPLEASSPVAEAPECAIRSNLESLCPCLLEDRRQEVGEGLDDDRFELECNIERYGDGAVVLEVGGYELYGMSYYLAVGSESRWNAVARLGEREINGLGGHYASFEVEDVRVIERGSAKLLRVETRSSNSFYHPPRSGTREAVEVTLCRIERNAAKFARCLFQAPIFMLKSSRISEDDPGDEDLDSESDESSTLETEEVVRLALRIHPDGRSVEIDVVEGSVPEAWKHLLGLHSLE